MADFKLRAVMEYADKSAQGLRSSIENVNKLGDTVNDAKQALSAMAIVAGAKAVLEFGKLGAEALRTKNSFEAISGGVRAAEANLNAMKAATRGAISEQQAMQQANRLLSMGIVNTAGELGRFTEVATRLGGVMGLDATQSIEQFSLMIANQSLPRLDAFGLSAGKARERILQLQAANEGMTREQAFMIATMEQGTAALERLGPAADDAALAFERATAQMEDAKIALAEQLAPATAGFLTLLATGTEEVGQWGMRLKQWYGGLAAAGLHVVGADDAAIGLLNTLDLLEKKTPIVRDEAEQLAFTYGIEAAEADMLANRHERLAEASIDAAMTQEEIKRQMDMLKTALAGPVGKETEAYTQKQRELRGSLAEIKAELDELNAKPWLSGEEQKRARELTLAYGGTQNELRKLDEQHRATMNRIVFDMMMARLAVDGFDEREAELATNMARNLGLIDDETWEMASSMNDALDSFAAGASVEETIKALDRISGAVEAIPKNPTINLGLNVPAELAGVISHTELMAMTGAGGGTSVPVPTSGAAYMPESASSYVPQYAGGTTHHPGGLAVVHSGEMILPRGAQVVPVETTRMNDYSRGDVVYNVYDSRAASILAEQERLNELARLGEVL